MTNKPTDAEPKEELRGLNVFWYDQYRLQLDLIYNEGMRGGDHYKLKDSLDTMILNLISKEVERARIEELENLQGQEMQLRNSPAIRRRLKELKPNQSEGEVE